MKEIKYDANVDNAHLNNYYNRTHRGKLLVAEGLDSCGKSTQTKLITEYLDSIGKTYKQIHFPMYGQNEFADTMRSISFSPTEPKL